MKEVLYSNQAPQPIGPYSQAILGGGFVFISGQICLDNEGNLHNGSIEEETHQVMKNIGAILKSKEMDYKHIVKTTLFIRNMDDFVKINEAYGKYFSENPPARETVEVSRLPKNVNIEISVIACQ